MTLDQPLRIVWIVPALIAGVAVVVRIVRHGSRLHRLTRQSRTLRTTDVLLSRSVTETCLVVAAVCLLFVATAEPRWGLSAAQDLRDGVSLVLAYDVSHSMYANDIEPTRLARAKTIGRSLVRRVAYPTGVVAFSNAGVTIAPVTDDRVSIDAAILGLDRSFFSNPSSSLAAGLSAGFRAFPSGSAHRRVIVLFTDAEEVLVDSQSRWAPGLTEDTTVVVVLTGTTDGSVVPSAAGLPIRDALGNAVVSRANRALATRIATESSGLVVDAAAPSATTEIEVFIEGLEQRLGGEPPVRLEPRRRYRVFVVGSLILYVGALLARWSPLKQTWR